MLLPLVEDRTARVATVPSLLSRVFPARGHKSGSANAAQRDHHVIRFAIYRLLRSVGGLNFDQLELTAARFIPNHPTESLQGSNPSARRWGGCGNPVLTIEDCILIGLKWTDGSLGFGDSAMGPQLIGNALTNSF